MISPEKFVSTCILTGSFCFLVQQFHFTHKLPIKSKHERSYKEKKNIMTVTFEEYKLVSKDLYVHRKCGCGQSMTSEDFIGQRRWAVILRIGRHESGGKRIPSGLGLINGCYNYRTMYVLTYITKIQGKIERETKVDVLEI